MAAPLPTTQKAPPRFWNVPNSLTVSRLVLGLIVCVFVTLELPLLALGFFAAAALSDWLDGYLARKLSQETAIGRQLDSLVDKLIVCAALVYLVSLKGSGVQPWMVTAIVTRELIVQAVRSLIEGRGEPFGARMAGNLKTTFQCLAVVAVFAVLGFPAWAEALSWPRDILLWTAVGLTVYSGAAYLVIAWPLLKGSS